MHDSTVLLRHGQAAPNMEALELFDLIKVSLLPVFECVLLAC